MYKRLFKKKMSRAEAIAKAIDMRVTVLLSTAQSALIQISALVFLGCCTLMRGHVTPWDSG
jgi:hypothetical protein